MREKGNGLRRVLGTPEYSGLNWLKIRDVRRLSVVVF